MCSDEFSLKHALNRPMYHRRPGFKGHDPQLLDRGWGRVVGLGGNNKFPERGGKCSVLSKIGENSKFTVND